MKFDKPITYRQWKGIDPPEIELAIHTVEVTVATRRLRAVWTPELAQEIEMFRNIDAEEELTAILAHEIGQEIDRNIIHEIGLIADINKILFYQLSPGKYIPKPEPFKLNNKKQYDYE